MASLPLSRCGGALLFPVVLFSLHCAAVSQINIISTEQEVALGRQFSGEVEKEMKMYDDVEVQSYIDSLGQLLAAHSDRTEIEYHVKVVDTDDVNAFALPGGWLYVNRGLILSAENEAELAAVMGHEIGHIVGKHGARQMTGRIGLSALLGMALGENPGMVSEMVANLVATGTLLKYGRDMEREADRLGIDETYRAGIDPSGMASFFGKLLELEGGRETSGVEQFFSTHPPTKERIDNANRYAGGLPPKAGLTTDSERFHAIRKRLPPLRGGS